LPCAIDYRAFSPTLNTDFIQYLCLSSDISPGKVSARGESPPEVPGRFPHTGKVCRKFREGFLLFIYFPAGSYAVFIKGVNSVAIRFSKKIDLTPPLIT
jgi:hypothetical protein